MTVVFVNTGTLVADFIVSVLGCTHGTFDVAAQTRSVAPAQVATATFALRYSLVDGATDAACNVTLQDATYAVTDWRQHNFNVTARRTDEGAQGGEPAGGSLGGPALPPQGSADSGGGGSCTDCPFYNPVCFLLRSCFWQVIVQIVVVVAIVAAIVFVVRHRRAICCCLYESKEQREERLHREAVAAQVEALDRAVARRRAVHDDDDFVATSPLRHRGTPPVRHRHHAETYPVPVSPFASPRHLHQHALHPQVAYADAFYGDGAYPHSQPPGGAVAYHYDHPATYPTSPFGRFRQPVHPQAAADPYAVGYR
uniref:Generative cell specific-1/HAP2 domain-containing protein n=1 Tax=Neobodo designis TaxID=312471 RepID=A0A7S1MJ85_NEODS